MGTRLELQAKLEAALGSRNVYYQPPASVTMNYPAIVYSKAWIKNERANNVNDYMKTVRYSITVIDRRPDNPAIDAMLTWPYCVYDRHYISDNLNHDVLTLYY